MRVLEGVRIKFFFEDCKRVELSDHLNYVVEVQQRADSQNSPVSTYNVSSAVLEDDVNQNNQFDDAHFIAADVVPFLKMRKSKAIFTPFPLQVTLT